MQKNVLLIQKVRLRGETFYKRLQETGLSCSSLSRELGISRNLLQYHVFHVTHRALPRLAAELRRRARLLEQLAGELEQAAAEIEENKRLARHP